MVKEDKKEKVIPCLNCIKGHTLKEVAESTDKVPMWSKKAGNYSPLPKMLTCDERYNLQEPDALQPETPKLHDSPIKLTLDDLPSNVWVFVWASVTSEDPLYINGPIEAYQDDINHCLQKTDDEGVVEITLNCPQPYRVDGTTYSRHIHYVFENKEEKIWSTMKTFRFTSVVTRDELEEILDTKKAIVIFSMPEEFYEKDHIPGSLNLPRESLDKLSEAAKVKHVTQFLKDNLKKYPDIKEAVDDKRLDIRDVPIVTYCMSDTCKSSGRLLEHFYECGVNNVSEYTPGLKGWKQKVSSSDIEEATDTKEPVTFFDSESDDDDKEDDKEDDDKDDDDDDEKDMEYEGVPYMVRRGKKDELLNDNWEHIGNAKIKDGAIVSVSWISKEAEREHKKHRIPKEGEEEEPEPEEEQEAESGSKSEDQEEQDDQEQDEEQKKSQLKDKDKSELKKYISELLEREAKTYRYKAIKKKKGEDSETYKERVVDAITTCQQYSKSTGDYPYHNREDLQGLSEEELLKIWTSLPTRGRKTFRKSGRTPNNKPDMIKYITTCEGTSSQGGGEYVPKRMFWGRRM